MPRNVFVIVVVVVVEPKRFLFFVSNFLFSFSKYFECMYFVLGKRRLNANVQAKKGTNPIAVRGTAKRLRGKHENTNMNVNVNANVTTTYLGHQSAQTQCLVFGSPH